MPQRLNPETSKGYRFKNRAGERNGRLTFTRHLGLDAHKHHVWEAVCDCGVVTTTSQPHKTRSCGCYQREVAAQTQKAKAMPPDDKAAKRRENASRQRARRRNDPVAVMHARLSRLHRHALKQVGGIKASPTFEELGYTVGEFVVHIERQFLPGMGWHNVSDWQIDHIIPISEAKTEADVVALNQLSNLRPMWASENSAKRARRVSLL